MSRGQPKFTNHRNDLRRIFMSQQRGLLGLLPPK